MKAKGALIDELDLLYAEEYRALKVSAGLVAWWALPCLPSSLLHPYFDETEEHLLRLLDVFDYLDCSRYQTTAPIADAQDSAIATPGTLFLVGKAFRTANPMDAFLLLDRSVLDCYRASLSQARAFGRKKVVEILFQSFQEKVAMQQRLSNGLATNHDSLDSPEADRMFHPILLESGGFR